MPATMPCSSKSGMLWEGRALCPLALHVHQSSRHHLPAVIASAQHHRLILVLAQCLLRLPVDPHPKVDR